MAIYASLKPSNTVAKIAFSEAFEAAMHGRRGQTDGATTAALRMEAGDEQEYHVDVLRFRLEQQMLREAEQQGLREEDDNYISGSLTEPNTETELDNRRLGMIWSGPYLFSLDQKPLDAPLGWTVGKGPVKGQPDIILSMKSFARQHVSKLRTVHARFNFDMDTGAFFVVCRASLSSGSEVIVNGNAVGGQVYTLNQHAMNIQISSLAYLFQYTEFATTVNFLHDRRRYITGPLLGPITTVFEMPTPLPQTRTVGQWTISNPLGKGADGRVSLASNSKNEIAAVKVMERNAGSAGRVGREIRTYQELTDLAREKEDFGRIVKLREVTYSNGEAELSSVSTRSPSCWSP